VNFRLQDQTEVSPSDAFFITGSGRCGTTLLRRLIVEKSGAVIPPENYSLGVSGRFSSAAQQDWGLSCRLIIGEVQRDSPQNGAFGVDAAMAISLLSSIPPEHRTIANFWHAFHAIYATHVGKPSVSRWGDKTPLNAARLDNIIELFPTARFIFMIRDIFDVAYSYGSMDVVGRRGKYLDQSPRKAPKEIGFESAIRLELTNTGQNGADPHVRWPPAKCESNAGQNAINPTMNSTELATTATLLTTSITQ